MQRILKNPLPWLVQMVGVLVVILNLWIASKLAPIATDIAIITKQVEALEQADSAFIPRPELEALIRPIQEDVVEIKSDVKDIRSILVR